MDKAAAKEFEVFCGKEIKPDDWLWCKRCHRCYQAIEFRKMTTKGEVFLFCHYKDCHGDLPMNYPAASSGVSIGILLIFSPQAAGN